MTRYWLQTNHYNTSRQDEYTADLSLMLEQLLVFDVVPIGICVLCKIATRCRNMRDRAVVSFDKLLLREARVRPTYSAVCATYSIESDDR